MTSGELWKYRKDGVHLAKLWVPYLRIYLFLSDNTDCDMQTRLSQIYSADTGAT